MKKEDVITLRLPIILGNYLRKKAKEEEISLSKYLIISVCKGAGIKHIPEQFKIPSSKKVTLPNKGGKK